MVDDIKALCFAAFRDVWACQRIELFKISYFAAAARRKPLLRTLPSLMMDRAKRRMTS